MRHQARSGKDKTGGNRGRLSSDGSVTGATSGRFCLGLQGKNPLKAVKARKLRDSVRSRVQESPGASRRSTVQQSSNDLLLGPVAASYQNVNNLHGDFTGSSEESKGSL